MEYFKVLKIAADMSKADIKNAIKHKTGKSQGSLALTLSLQRHIVVSMPQLLSC